MSTGLNDFDADLSHHGAGTRPQTATIRSLSVYPEAFVHHTVFCHADLLQRVLGNFGPRRRPGFDHLLGCKFFVFVLSYVYLFYFYCIDRARAPAGCAVPSFFCVRLRSHFNQPNPAQRGVVMGGKETLIFLSCRMTILRDIFVLLNSSQKCRNPKQFANGSCIQIGNRYTRTLPNIHARLKRSEAEYYCVFSCSHREHYSPAQKKRPLSSLAHHCCLLPFEGVLKNLKPCSKIVSILDPFSAAVAV